MPNDELEPADDADDPAEGNLGSLTDEQWREAHEALRRKFDAAPGESPDLSYTWAPDRKSQALAEIERPSP